MSRRETPDILGTLMVGTKKPESSKAIKQDSQERIKQENHKAIKLESKKTITQTYFEGTAPPVQPLLPVLKEKATFNLSKAVLEDLEDCWMEIRKLRGDKKISKTDIVELALENAIKEFKLKKQLSQFYSKLKSNKAIKRDNNK